MGRWCWWFMALAMLVVVLGHYLGPVGVLVTVSVGIILGMLGLALDHLERGY